MTTKEKIEKRIRKAHVFLIFFSLVFLTIFLCIILNMDDPAGFINSFYGHWYIFFLIGFPLVIFLVSISGLKEGRFLNKVLWRIDNNKKNIKILIIINIFIAVVFIGLLIYDLIFT